MSAPQSANASFAATYRHHVMSSLITKSRVCGTLVALDVLAFERAHYAVMRTAIRRGALHLPEIIFADLDEWVATRLTQVAASLEVEVAAARQRAENVARQCRLCEALAAVPPCAP